MGKTTEDSFKISRLSTLEPIVVDSESFDGARQQRDFETNLTLPEARERLGQQRLVEIIGNYLSYYASGQGHTARAKRYDLNHFLAFLAGSRTPDSVSVSEWTLQATKDFIDHRLSIGESPATVSRRLATIKHFGRTLAERVSGYINPAREARGPTIQASKPHGLSVEELSLLRKASAQMLSDKPEEFVSLRNHTMIELFLATGLRADEVRLLYAGQISEDLSWLRNVKTKGKKFRNVYLDSGIRDPLSAYLEARNRYLGSKFSAYTQLSAKERKLFPVFVSSYGASLDAPKSCGVSAKSVWRIVSGLGKVASSMAEANSMPNIHPHKLRHTFAHGLLDSSKDVRLVAQALGHSDVRTTMRYTERTEEEIAKAIEKKISSDS